MTKEKPFRILSLSGGGIRGIFQAAFLRSLDGKLDSNPLHSYFDLIVGTSTGSIVGLAIALGIDTQLLYEKYRTLGGVVFEKSYFSWLRKGGRYKHKALRESLQEIFGDKRLSDAHTGILVTATSLDRYSHKTFFSYPTEMKDDYNLLALDVVLASSAAPSFFTPVKLSNQERTYSDGGLWANNPSLLGILKANREFGIPLENIRVLSIGTGMFPNSLPASDFINTRTINPKLLRAIINLFSSAQGTFADEYSISLIGEMNYLNVNAQLQEIIELDDTRNAIDFLPAQAEELAEKNLHSFKELFSSSDFKAILDGNKLPINKTVPLRIIAEAGLTGFYPSRDHYSKHRKEVGSISAYASTATRKLTMVSINLSTGDKFEGIRKVLIDKLTNNPHFQLCISLLDPREHSLMTALAPGFDTTAQKLSESIHETLNNLVNDRASLSEHIAKRWDIGVHKSIPFGSAIIIDEDQPNGRIQIETKPYKAPLNSSFAFEVVPTSKDSFFYTLTNGYQNLIKDGDSLISKDLYQPRRLFESLLIKS